MKFLNCAEMVKEYLKKNKYDGLVASHGECGCKLDDLMPCGGDYVMDCEAGYEMDCNCGEGCNSHIGQKKINKKG